MWLEQQHMLNAQGAGPFFKPDQDAGQYYMPQNHLMQDQQLLQRTDSHANGMAANGMAGPSQTTGDGSRGQTLLYHPQ